MLTVLINKSSAHGGTRAQYAQVQIDQRQSGAGWFDSVDLKVLRASRKTRAVDVPKTRAPTTSTYRRSSKLLGVDAARIPPWAFQSTPAPTRTHACTSVGASTSASTFTSTGAHTGTRGGILADN